MGFNLVRYSQQDPQWKNTPIGPGPDTIGYIGCALTCISMYLSGWGYPETPATLNQKMNAHGGFTPDELLIWGAVSNFYPQVKCVGLNVYNGTVDAPIAQIDASIAAGNPVIVEVDYSPAAGLQTHWVLLYAKQGNDYLMQDPYPNPPETNQVTLMSRFSQGQPLQRAIKAIVWYQTSASGTGTTPPTTPTTTPATTPSTTPVTIPVTTPLPAPIPTDLVLQVVAAATAGIRLHIQPAADSPANVAEMPGVPLNVIEDKNAALAKLGVNNQWIYVRDPQGQQGYVAAWFVEKAAAASTAPTSTSVATPASTPPTTTPVTPTPPVTPTTTPASAPSRLVVIVSQSVGTNGLRLRQVPSMGGALLAIEKAGSQLTVLEPNDKALAKVGVAGQWLNVRDTNGLIGYVAAEYIQLKS
jgi:hypothetical protein